MNKIATISIILEDVSKETVARVNDLLNDYQGNILGRMGLPDKVHKVNLISLSVFATEDEINSLTGKLGSVNGVVAKALFSNKSF